MTHSFPGVLTHGGLASLIDVEGDVAATRMRLREYQFLVSGKNYPSAPLL